MEPSQHRASIARDAATLRAAAERAGLDAVVPSCPGWTVADLVWHVATVYYFWGSVVAQRAAGPNDVVRPERVPQDRIFTAFDANLDRLLEVLDSTEPSTEVWTWSADHSAGFVNRRMAHETAVHRWDAEQADGAPTAIDAELASDGIDEFLEHFLPDAIDGAAVVGGSVHIHCGDVAGEWTIRGGDDGTVVTREHAKGDCALRGEASNLLLTLWRRTGADTIDVVGDAAVAQRFLAATNLA